MVGADQDWVAALLKANVFAGPAAFNTFGLAMFQPSHVAVGAVLIDAPTPER